MWMVWTPATAFHTSCMAMKAVAIVVGRLWLNLFSLSSPGKDWSIQMRVGNLILIVQLSLLISWVWLMLKPIATTSQNKDFVNTRHSMTTRFVLTCISSYFFDEGNTLDDLHQFIAEDANILYHEGITVPSMQDRPMFSTYLPKTNAMIKMI